MNTSSTVEIHRALIEWNIVHGDWQQKRPAVYFTLLYLWYLKFYIRIFVVIIDNENIQIDGKY